MTVGIKERPGTNANLGHKYFLSKFSRIPVDNSKKRIKGAKAPQREGNCLPSAEADGKNTSCHSSDNPQI
jgi:hypothetical protein